MARHRKRRHRAMVVTYRHPITGAPVHASEGQDAELMCLEQSGTVAESVLARMRELTAQSAQNRARIVKRLLGGPELVPPVAR